MSLEVTMTFCGLLLCSMRRILWEDLGFGPRRGFDGAVTGEASPALCHSSLHPFSASYLCPQTCSSQPDITSTGEMLAV